LQKAYSERISLLMMALRRKYGFSSRHERASRRTHPALEGPQMQMFE
jgi:hypothetical protein